MRFGRIDQALVVWANISATKEKKRRTSQFCQKINRGKKHGHRTYAKKPISVAKNCSVDALLEEYARTAFGGRSLGEGWEKFAPQCEGGRFAEIIADATIVWPLLASGLIEPLGDEPLQKNLVSIASNDLVVFEGSELEKPGYPKILRARSV